MYEKINGSKRCSNCGTFIKESYSICHRCLKDPSYKFYDVEPSSGKMLFKIPYKHTVKNRYLYAIMIASDIKILELAQATGKSRSSIRNHIYVGRVPKDKEVYESVLGLSGDILFDLQDISNERHHIQMTERFLERGLYRNKKPANRMLYGFLRLHENSVPMFAKSIGIGYNLARKMIYQGYIPSSEYVKKVCKHYDVPERILFNKEDIRRRCSE